MSSGRTDDSGSRAERGGGGAIHALRWYAKKAARRSVATGSLLAPRRPGLRALTYHRFGPAYHDPFCVGTEQFERQMTTLARSGMAVSLARVEEFLAGGAALEDGSILVTIDDGDPSVHDLALPILARHRIPAVAYVIAGAIGERRSIDLGRLRSLAEAGVTIGSHSWSHRSLGSISPDEVSEEATRSQRRLEDWLGRPVRSFAYPFGTRSDFSREIARTLGERGYVSAFTSQHGVVTRKSDALLLPRIKVEGGEGSWMFGRLLRGGMDRWSLVDRALWRLQAADRG